MNTHSVTVFIRKDQKRKDNSLPIYLRVIISRKKKDFTLGIFVKPEEWNEKKLAVRASVTDSVNLNRKIDAAVKKANTIIANTLYDEGEIDIYKFSTLYKNEDVVGTFKEFALKEIERRKHEYSYEYCRNFKSEISKLDKFKKDVKLKDMDIDFILDYERYMVEVLGNGTNTVGKTMKRLKRLLNWAKQGKLIKVNPYEEYRIKFAPTNRKFLAIEEVNILFELYQKGNLKKYQQNVLRYFLFSCFTGLRYTDVSELKKKHIQGDMISIEMHKVKREVRIPITEKAKVLLPNSLNLEDEEVFKVATNQVVNRVLKEIIKIAGIRKNITFHCARHTFATIALTLGIRIEVVSDLLGHNDLKMTRIYAKIVDNLRNEEMKKFNF